MLLKAVCLAGILPLVLFAADGSATDREEALLDRIEQLEKRVNELEARAGVTRPQPATVSQAAQSAPAPAETSAKTATAEVAQAASVSPAVSPAQTVPDFLRGTTVNFQVDGYYGYNFNAPIGRANLLRAYDVLSNAFSLNQANVVIENAPDPANGKPYGARLDLQWGEATETLQANAANELRPEIYRAIFQAYGTYVIPVGTGITVDFGKWASSLGVEGNYTKDQINYSRSFWFNYLPFYHMGARVNYKVNDVLGLNYWVTNGTEQTEPFNGYKDELVGFTLQPRKSVNWTVNYYLGQEHPDVIFYPNAAPGSLPNLPTLQGVPFEPIPNAPKGHLNIIDTYATIQASPKIELAFEGDYVNQRLYTNSLPGYTYGGAWYLRYQVSPRLALAGRGEYLADHAGLFSGTAQVLREATLTTEYKFGDGFLTRLEWRRDLSNQPYFLTDTLGLLRKEQSTAEVGLVWWFGAKQGAW
jgi:cell division septum initiation protein DivIVA